MGDREAVGGQEAVDDQVVARHWETAGHWQAGSAKVEEVMEVAVGACLQFDGGKSDVVFLPSP